MKTIILTFTALLPLSASANPFLNIYVAPPESSLDWSSPGSLYRSLLKSRIFFTQRPYGSAGADLVCGNETFSLSMDAESFDVVGPVLFQGKGLGHLYSAHPGVLLTGPQAVAKNRAVINTPGAHFMTFLISNDHCRRIRSFWEEVQKNNIAKNYGLPHRPLMAEGATDTSLVVSTLEVVGLLVPDQRDNWKRVLFLPKNLSGAPLTDDFISFFSLLGGEWGKNSNGAFPLQFWDPELIRNWIENQIRTRKSIRKLSDVTKGIPGVEYDLRSRPVPQGTFWEQATDPAYQNSHLRRTQENFPKK